MHRIWIKELKISAIPHHKGENWVGIFSLNIFSPDLIAPVELNEKILWAMEDAYPHYKLGINNKKKCRILSGILQG